MPLALELGNTALLVVFVFGLGTLCGMLLQRRRARTLAAAAARMLSEAQGMATHAAPRSVLAWPDVAPAPAPTMAVEHLTDGGVVTHRDGRGAIYRMKLGEGVYVNLYHTKAGYRRSGDLHDCEQYDVVLKGRVRLRMLDPHSGREVLQELRDNDFAIIPARWPHMFEFLEDNYLLEWWGADFQAWYYSPYRSVIEANLPLAATEGRDFSIPAPPATAGRAAAVAAGATASRAATKKAA